MDVIYKFVGINPVQPDLFWNFFSGAGTILALIALLLSIWKFKKDIRQKEIAQYNILIDELYHNLNLSSMFSPKLTTKSVEQLIGELNTLSLTERYPNPTDNFVNNADYTHRLFSIFDQNELKSTGMSEGKYIKFHNSAITEAMATGSAAILSNKRIFLNLGHLNYSINRMNSQYEYYNSLIEPHDIYTVKKEYLEWLHFRLLFTFIDLLRSIPEKHVYDKNTLRHYKEIAGNIWNINLQK